MCRQTELDARNPGWPQPYNDYRRGEATHVRQQTTAAVILTASLYDSLHNDSGWTLPGRSGGLGWSASKRVGEVLVQSVRVARLCA